MGFSMYKMKPIDGFAAQTAGAAVIAVASHFGQPVSTTHVISSTILGVGASKRLTAVRWGTARDILWAWVLTLPVTVALGAGITLLLKQFMK